jgi:hypothetical protein
VVIICGYPGIGTNRFRRLLTNKKYTEDKINYDKDTNYGVDKSLKDPLSTEDSGDIITCHVMNYNQVIEYFGDCTVIKLWSDDLMQCLHRFWDVFWKDQVGDTSENAFSVIAEQLAFYHHNVDKEADILIDVDNSQDNFSKLIRKQLVLHKNKKFLAALDAYNTYGIHAPITDIVNGKSQEQILESIRLNELEALERSKAGNLL